jgi:hypothetical protein
VIYRVPVVGAEPVDAARRASARVSTTRRASAAERLLNVEEVHVHVPQPGDQLPPPAANGLNASRRSHQRGRADGCDPTAAYQDSLRQPAPARATSMIVSR